jgi:hypothetical protein
MKRRALFCCLAATLLAAQAPAPEVEITNEPHHHLTFENQSVRVFKVQVDPNAETLTHWHRHDYIAISLGPAEVSNTVKDKPPVTIKFQDGEARFTLATFAHFVRDLGDQPFRNVTVEILEDQSLRHSELVPKRDPKPDPKREDDRGLKALRGGTKQTLFVKDNIRATGFELQPGGVAPRLEYAGPHLFVAVTDLDLRENIKGEGPALAHYKSGESKWLLPNYSVSITNAGAKPAKYVTLEWPQKALD